MADGVRSEAAWAHMCAVAPIPVSSGRTHRHRLNRGGNREANHALWRIVITRMSAHPATRAYVALMESPGSVVPVTHWQAEPTGPSRAESPPIGGACRPRVVPEQPAIS